MFELLQASPIGAKEHRSGWPLVYSCLRKHARTDARVFLDDFIDATVSYDSAIRQRASQWERKPWVGIFHHPVECTSPLSHDRRLVFQNVRRATRLVRNERNLIGTIALAPCLADTLRKAFACPVLLLKHPTGEPLRMWDADIFFAAPRLFQAGFFMRDTGAIFRVDVPSNWGRARVRPWLHWQKVNEQMLRNPYLRSEHKPAQVIGMDRLENEVYDDVLAESVVLSHLFGAAANNVIVECIARCTPVVTNRIRATEYYLGDDYPLLYDKLDEVPGLLEDERRILAAHEHLRDMPREWLSAELFAKQVAEYCNDPARAR